MAEDGRPASTRRRAPRPVHGQPVLLARPERSNAASPLARTASAGRLQRLAQRPRGQAHRPHQGLDPDRVHRGIGEMQHVEIVEPGLAMREGILAGFPRLRDHGHLARDDVAGHVRRAVAAERHRRRHQAQIGRAAAHDRHVGPGRANLRHLPHPGRAFLQHHHVVVPGQTQQVVPVQVGLHARRVVVEAHRQVGAVQHLQRIVGDRGVVGADVGGRGDDRAVGAFGLGVAHVVDGARGVVAGAAIVYEHGAGLHLRRLRDDGAAFLGAEHRDFAGRSHDQHRLGAVLGVPVQEGTEALEVDGPVFVHRGDKGHERPFGFDMGHAILPQKYCGTSSLGSHSINPGTQSERTATEDGQPADRRRGPHRPADLHLADLRGDQQADPVGRRHQPDGRASGRRRAPGGPGSSRR